MNVENHLEKQGQQNLFDLVCSSRVERHGNNLELEQFNLDEKNYRDVMDQLPIVLSTQGIILNEQNFRTRDLSFYMQNYQDELDDLGITHLNAVVEITKQLIEDNTEIDFSKEIRVKWAVLDGEGDQQLGVEAASYVRAELMQEVLFNYFYALYYQQHSQNSDFNEKSRNLRTMILALLIREFNQRGFRLSAEFLSRKGLAESR